MILHTLILCMHLYQMIEMECSCFVKDIKALSCMFESRFKDFYRFTL